MGEEPPMKDLLFPSLECMKRLAEEIGRQHAALSSIRELIRPYIDQVPGVTPNQLEMACARIIVAKLK